ncbi:MAG: isochorismatase family cysteine hydrolase [Candidatus Aminicenantes bacterium]|jgi:nicotinamidase-related amidase
MSIPSLPGKNVEVPEIPYKDRIVLSAKNSALIIVDMQNDFVKPGGNLMVPAAAATIPRIQKLLRSAREAQVPIAYTQDTTFEGDPEFDIWPEHCKIHTWGWDIIPELEPQKGDLVCQKSRYDGFYGTWLEHFLSYVWEVKHLIIVGTVSNICVLHTAAAAGLRWFHVVVPADGISALTEFDQALTLRQVSSLYSGDVLKATVDIRFE